MSIINQKCIPFTEFPNPRLNSTKGNCSYLLTPWSRVLLEKLTGLQLVKKFPAFYGTRRFITALTSARHLSLSWASSIQSTHSHPTSRRSILLLSSHLRLGLPSGLLPSGFSTRTLYTPFPSPIRATCPAHLILLDFITAQYWVRSTLQHKLMGFYNRDGKCLLRSTDWIFIWNSLRFVFKGLTFNIVLILGEISHNIHILGARLYCRYVPYIISVILFSDLKA